MDDNKAIEILKNNVPKTCKIVDGRYQGGFDDWKSDMGQAIETAAAALKKQIPQKPERDNMTTICPECGRPWKRCYFFCPDCGQKIDWN